MRAGRALAILGSLAAAGYILYRLFIHSSTLLTPAIVTPQMDAHAALSPKLDARVHRLLHEHIDTDRTGRPKLVALTFDDGPYPVTTPLLLDVLHDLDVPATFFLIGRDAAEFPELTRRIERQGHEIANHTYSHPNLDQLSAAGVKRELLDGARVLHGLVSDPAVMTLMRPPHGRFTEETVRVAQSLGYHVVLWNDDGGDWRTITVRSLAEHLEQNATAPEIVLLHSGRLVTIEMLPEVVTRFRAARFRFVTVGELLRRTNAEEINHPAKMRV